MKPDKGRSAVDIPPVLRAALSAAPRAKAAFDALAPSHRTEYVRWIGSARKEETRDRRVLAAVRMLEEGGTQRRPVGR